MSITISPPIRVFALLGVLAATGLAAALFLLGRAAGESEPIASPTPTTRAASEPSSTASTPRTAVSKPRAAAVTTKSGFPAPVDRALRHDRVLVVVVYMPGARVDSIVRAEARAAASKTGAGYVAISAVNERLVRPLVAKAGVLPDPAVLILERPGVVRQTLSVTDRDTIAQAIVQARR